VCRYPPPPPHPFFFFAMAKWANWGEMGWKKSIELQDAGGRKQGFDFRVLQTVNSSTSPCALAVPMYYPKFLRLPDFLQPSVGSKRAAGTRACRNAVERPRCGSHCIGTCLSACPLCGIGKSQHLPAVCRRRRVTCSSACMFLQMVLALIVVASTLAIAGAQPWVAWFVLFFICIYIAAYAWYPPPPSAPSLPFSADSCHLAAVPSQLGLFGWMTAMTHRGCVSGCIAARVYPLPPTCPKEPATCRCGYLRLLES